MNIGVLPQAVTLTREWKTTWVTGLKTGGWRIGEGCWSKENSKNEDQTFAVEKTKPDCSCLGSECSHKLHICISECNVYIEIL